MGVGIGVTIDVGIGVGEGVPIMLGVRSVGAGICGAIECDGEGSSLFFTVADWNTAYAPRASTTAITTSNTTKIFATVFSFKLKSSCATRYLVRGECGR
jgi:hypothetical protein